MMLLKKINFLLCNKRLIAINILFTILFKYILRELYDIFMSKFLVFIIFI